MQAHIPKLMMMKASGCDLVRLPIENMIKPTVKAAAVVVLAKKTRKSKKLSTKNTDMIVSMLIILACSCSLLNPFIFLGISQMTNPDPKLDQ